MQLPSLLDLLVPHHRPVGRLHRAHFRIRHGQPRFTRLEPGRQRKGGLVQQNLREEKFCPRSESKGSSRTRELPRNFQENLELAEWKKKTGR